MRKRRCVSLPSSVLDVAAAGDSPSEQAPRRVRAELVLRNATRPLSCLLHARLHCVQDAPCLVPVFDAGLFVS
jgi:hypothetical protein